MKSLKPAIFELEVGLDQVLHANLRYVIYNISGKNVKEYSNKMVNK